MSRELNCKICKKHMATLRDAKVRDGMVVYCAECAAKLDANGCDAIKVPDHVYDFFKGLNNVK